MSLNAFMPLGKTIEIDAPIVTPPTGVRASTFSGTLSPATVFRIRNSGSSDVAFAWGVDAAEAQTNAVFPTSGTPQKCIVLGSGTIETFTLPSGSFFSALSLAGTAQVFVTPGEGQ
mgnify:CR=1 FL=1